MTNPVDNQNVFSRTVQIQRVQQNLLNQQVNQQGEFAQQMQKNTVERQERVASTDEAAMQRAEEGQEENKEQGRKGKRKKSDDTTDEDTTPPDPVRGHIIDFES